MELCCFLNQKSNMKKTIYLGCDPGKDGFFTAFDGTNFTFYAMPEHKVETGELIYCIVSYIPSPAVTRPPGLLI